MVAPKETKQKVAGLTSAYDEYKKELLEKIKKERNNFYHPLRAPYSSGKRIVSKIKTSREEIANKDAEQNIKLKRHTLYALFGFLVIETILIFLYSFWQATNIFNFGLEEWSFKLLIAATISQITYMMQVAVKHLFPNKN